MMPASSRDVRRWVLAEKNAVVDQGCQTDDTYDPHPRMQLQMQLQSPPILSAPPDLADATVRPRRGAHAIFRYRNRHASFPCTMAMVATMLAVVLAIDPVVRAVVDTGTRIAALRHAAHACHACHACPDVVPPPILYVPPQRMRMLMLMHAPQQLVYVPQQPMHVHVRSHLAPDALDDWTKHRTLSANLGDGVAMMVDQIVGIAMFIGWSHAAPHA